LITGLEHIGIAVNKIDDALQVFENILGLKLEKTKTFEPQKIKIAILHAGETKIELLEPIDKEAAVAKFLEKKGEGIHHIAFKVRGIEDMLQKLKTKGITLIDEKPREGAEGGKIAFLHPKSTRNVLIELCER
jgi:methylmalonyl-CoA/ethylmalonyl-CoA epimerase